MGVRLQRLLGETRGLEAGQYCVLVEPTLAGDLSHVYVCCPCCGGVRDLRDRQIDTAGRVSPAFACPTETCAFFEFIELESWGDHG